MDCTLPMASLGALASRMSGRCETCTRRRKHEQTNGTTWKDMERHGTMAWESFKIKHLQTSSNIKTCQDHFCEKCKIDNNEEDSHSWCLQALIASNAAVHKLGHWTMRNHEHPEFRHTQSIPKLFSLCATGPHWWQVRPLHLLWRAAFLHRPEPFGVASSCYLAPTSWLQNLQTCFQNRHHHIEWAKSTQICQIKEPSLTSPFGAVDAEWGSKCWG